MKISLGPSPVDDNPLNELITLSHVWRCGEALFRANDDGGNCEFIIDVNVNHSVAIHAVIETKKSIRISIHPECPHFVDLAKMLESLRGRPGQMWRYEYGEDKSFTLDTVLTQELADKLNQYRLAF